jgi:hypothetical protein
MGPAASIQRGRSSHCDVLLIDTAKATGKNIQGRERPARKLLAPDVPRKVSGGKR